MMIFSKSGAALLLLVAVVYITGCISSRQNETPVPFGGKWLLIEMKERAEIPQGTFLFVNTESSSFQLSAGCNSFNGGYQTEGEKITFEPPAGTKKFCGELTEFESLYVRLLTSAAEAQIKRNVLQLYLNGELVLAFRKDD